MCIVIWGMKFFNIRFRGFLGELVVFVLRSEVLNFVVLVNIDFVIVWVGDWVDCMVEVGEVFCGELGGVLLRMVD